MEFVDENNFKGVFPYVDDIIIYRKDQEQYDANLKRFFDAAK